MEELLDSYPLSACRHASPMQRNPVCALTFGVCADLCNELGGLQFDIRKSVITADSLLAYLAQNACNPPDAEQCYRWLARYTNNSPPTIMCACAIVSVSISSMSDAPNPLKALGRNLRCLIYGTGNCMYDNLYSAAEEDNIELSLSAYITTPMILPPHPKKRPKRMQAKQYNQYNGTVFQGCIFTTNNTTNFYGTSPASDNHQEKEPRLKQLFDDPQRATEESNRFLNFLSDHNIRSRLIDSSQDNPILKAVVCFCAKWRNLRYIEPKYSPSAVLRFLTDTCSLQTDRVADRAIANALGVMIKNGYDEDLYYDVCDYF